MAEDDWELIVGRVALPTVEFRICLRLSGKGGDVRLGREPCGHGREVHRWWPRAGLLMPASVGDWVPEGHLVWTVLDAVGELDLSAFYADYRADGHGRPAYEPSMVVALLLYAYARGNRSARGIERACVEDVAYRVVAGNVAPDHATIAEFGCRHERALGEVFSGVLGLCARARLVSVGVVAIDGTKMSANASINANRDFGHPRAWGAEAEAGMAARVAQACELLGSAGRSIVG
jgi:transposase